MKGSSTLAKKKQIKLKKFNEDVIKKKVWREKGW